MAPFEKCDISNCLTLLWILGISKHQPMQMVQPYLSNIVWHSFPSVYCFTWSKRMMMHDMMMKKCVTSCYLEIRRKIILCRCLIAFDSDAGKCDNWKIKQQKSIRRVQHGLFQLVGQNRAVFFEDLDFKPFGPS